MLLNISNVDVPTLNLGGLCRVAQKKWNGILPSICGCNNWYDGISVLR